MVSIPIFFSIIAEISSIISLVVLCYGWYKLFHEKNTLIDVHLSCGSFRVKKKFFNRADLTTIVSNLFFNGGDASSVRKEISELTMKEGRDYEKSEQ